VVVIGVEATAVMVNLVCEVGEVDIVVDVVNLRQSRNNYWISIYFFMVYQSGGSRFSIFSTKNRHSFHHIHCFCTRTSKELTFRHSMAGVFSAYSMMKGVRVSFLVYYQRHDANELATEPARIYGRPDERWHTA